VSPLPQHPGGASRDAFYDRDLEKELKPHGHNL
jgi:hypothetical protein